ncbi:MAG: hypothetical protein Q9178_003090 [Gyalolechia marmorata]
MSRPSPLAISVASIRRLLKEETTYRTELKTQESRLQKLEAEGGEGDDGNREWNVRQEKLNYNPIHVYLEMLMATILADEQKQAIQETKAVFEPLREKLLGAVDGLEQLLVRAFLSLLRGVR